MGFRRGDPGSQGVENPSMCFPRLSINEQNGHVSRNEKFVKIEQIRRKGRCFRGIAGLDATLDRVSEAVAMVAFPKMAGRAGRIGPSL